MSEFQSTFDDKTRYLGLLLLKSLTGKESYEKIEVVKKLLSDEDYGDNCYVAILGKKEGLECIIVDSEGKEHKASKPIKIKENSTIDLKEKISISYIIDGRTLNLSYNSECTDGVYFKMELLPKAE
jgi:hypothetical protein